MRQIEDRVLFFSEEIRLYVDQMIHNGFFSHTLSGLTDFVVSITKVNGGLMTAPAPVPADCGQSMHLQATHLEKVFLTN